MKKESEDEEKQEEKRIKLEDEEESEVTKRFACPHTIVLLLVFSPAWLLFHH